MCGRAKLLHWLLRVVVRVCRQGRDGTLVSLRYIHNHIQLPRSFHIRAFTFAVAVVPDSSCPTWGPVRPTPSRNLENTGKMI